MAEKLVKEALRRGRGVLELACTLHDPAIVSEPLAHDAVHDPAAEV
jgi:hypothetical protein